MQTSQKTILAITISQLIYYLIPLGSFPLLLASFDVANYGIWIEATTIAGLFVALSSRALGNALGARIASNPQDADISFSSALVLFPAAGGAVGLVMFLAAP